jgi:hypothetical protein
VGGLVLRGEPCAERRARPAATHAPSGGHLIGSVSTEQGLKVSAELDANVYDAGIKVSDAELAAVAIERDAFHGEWNYRIKPRTRERDA